VTAFGAGLGLTNGDVGSPSHSHFVGDGGLNVVSRDNLNRIMTLAGVTTINPGGGFGVPEPGTLALLLLAIGIAASRTLVSRRAAG
jgi:hypothetical protein